MSVPTRNIMKLLDAVIRTEGEDRLKFVEANVEILRSEAAANVALSTIAVYEKLVSRLEKALAVVRAAQEADTVGPGGDQGEES